MTETTYTAFGLPMQRRSARRKLVVARLPSSSRWSAV